VKIDDICEVIITAPDADWLAQFTTDLVAQRLAACGHNVTPIRSIYRWHGEIYDVAEARVALHTRMSLVDRIVEKTNRDHPHEVPCVIATGLVAGNPSDYQGVRDKTSDL
jgi:periplasmic divalent cation tolerance protein